MACHQGLPDSISFARLTDGGVRESLPVTSGFLAFILLTAGLFLDVTAVGWFSVGSATEDVLVPVRTENREAQGKTRLHYCKESYKKKNAVIALGIGQSHCAQYNAVH